MAKGFALLLEIVRGEVAPERDDDRPPGFDSWAEWRAEQDPAMFEE